VQLAWFTENWARLNRALDSNHLPEETPWYARLAIKGVRPVDEDPDGALLAAAIREHANNYDSHAWARDVTYRDDVPRGAPGTADAFSPHAFIRDLKGSGAAVYGYSGWFDGAYQLAAIKRHLALGTLPHRLILGPWDHGGRRQVSPAAPSPKVQFDQAAELLRFFDHHLRGRINGIESEPPIHYFTMVAERWRTAERWPPPSSVWPLYLDAGGRLSPAPAKVTGTDTYRGDPSTGTGPATRWRSLLGGIGAAPYPNRTERDRRLLVYTSAPLAEAVEITGHPVVRLIVAANTTDAAVFAYLEDVDERGHVSYVTEGALRALHRRTISAAGRTVPPVPQRTFGRIHGRPLSPGVAVELTFGLLPTSWLFAKGHALRIAVAGADADYFAQVPAGDLPTFHIQRGGREGSRIDLPHVMP